MKRILCYVLAALMLVSLAACGSAQSDNPNVGTWTGVMVDALGMEGEIRDVFAQGATLELKANGNCTAIFDGDRANGKWTGSGSRLTLSIGGDDYRCTIDGDALVFEFMDDMNLIFTRNGRMPTSRVSSEPAEATDFRLTPNESASAEAPKPEAVMWIGRSVDMFGTQSDIEIVYANGVSIEIVDDGTCTLDFNGDSSTGTWEGSGSDMTINVGGQKYQTSIEGGVMTFELMEDILIFLEKDENSTTRSSADADGISGVSLADAIDWWDGEWYGTFYVYDTNEPYSDLKGTFIDVYAIIETEENGTGTVYLWSEDEEFGTVMITVSANDRSYMGTVAANGGMLFDEAVHFGDWNIDPFTCKYDNMIEIREVFTDEDGDWFDYEFLLRPWGADWEDVSSADQPLYYSWYMGVCGRPMLEVVREAGEMNHSQIR